MDVSWTTLFGPDEGWIAMAIRGTVVYWFVFALLRLAGRRDIGSLGVADLLVLLLVADAAGPAMAGDSTSLTDGMVVVFTIVFWSFLTDRMMYRFPWLQSVLQPGRVCLIRDGRVQRRGLRSEYITRGELMEELRLKGVDDLAQVRRAYMEATGEISVIRRDTPHGPPGRSAVPPED